MAPDRHLPCAQKANSGLCNDPAKTATHPRDTTCTVTLKPILIFTYFTTPSCLSTFPE